MSSTVRKCRCGKRRPSLGAPGVCSSRVDAVWCNQCPDKPLWAVDVVNRRCECKRSQPSFGLPGDKRKDARWCARCPNKPADAVNVKSPRCECGLRVPTMGLPNSGRQGAKWCMQCPNKPANAVNVSSRRCECGRSDPSLGILSDDPTQRPVPRWCSKCPGKPSEATNVVNKRCECGRCLPSLGLPDSGIKTARWCAMCPMKPPNAVNVVSKRCECKRGQPSLGLLGEPRKAARWCSKCPNKPIEAVNIVSKKCECGKGQPSLGLPGEPQKNARWCAMCPTKPAEAVNTYTMLARSRKRAAKQLQESDQPCLRLGDLVSSATGMMQPSNGPDLGHSYGPAGAETPESTAPVDDENPGRSPKNSWPGQDYDSSASGHAPPVPLMPGGAAHVGGNAVCWPGMMQFPFCLEWQQTATAPGNFHGRYVHDRPCFQGWDPYRFGMAFPRDAIPSGQWGLDLHSSCAMQPGSHKRQRLWNNGTMDRSQGQFRMPGMPEAYYFGSLSRRPGMPGMPPETSGFITPFSGLYAEDLGTDHTAEPLPGDEKQTPAKQLHDHSTPASRYYYEDFPRRGGTGTPSHASGSEACSHGC